MTDTPPAAEFVSLRELARRLGVCEKTARIATRAPGFPKPDRLYGGKWFWPAVDAFNRRRHGLIVEAPEMPDGPENWHGKSTKDNRRARIGVAQT